MTPILCNLNISCALLSSRGEPSRKHCTNRPAHSGARQLLGTRGVCDFLRRCSSPRFDDSPLPIAALGVRLRLRQQGAPPSPSTLATPLTGAHLTSSPATTVIQRQWQVDAQQAHILAARELPVRRPFIHLGPPLAPLLSLFFGPAAVRIRAFSEWCLAILLLQAHSHPLGSLTRHSLTHVWSLAASCRRTPLLPSAHTDTVCFFIFGGWTKLLNFCPTTFSSFPFPQPAQSPHFGPPGLVCPRTSSPRDRPAMGDLREYSEVSEEKTEPFSQSEIESRLQSARRGELGDAVSSTVSLDNLVVPEGEDIRILMRPLTRDRSVSPGNQEVCRWLALHAEVADKEQSQHKVLAVTQTPRDISFSVRIPGERTDDAYPRPPLWCELYYDPASDNQILVNRSHVPFTLSKVSQQPAGSPGEEYDVNPNLSKALAPGTWRIKVNSSEILDFRILEKRPARLRIPSSDSSSASTLSEMVNSAGKRSFVADDDEPVTPEKKPRPSQPATGKDDGVIMFLPRKTNPLVFPLPTAEKGKEIATSSGHPLLDLQVDETVEISGGCELDEYTITKREPIAATSLSSVFTADYSKVPDNVIVVKVLKTRSHATATNEALAARNVIHQADIWLRELQYQEDLQHKSIVRLYGGDARFLSLYMEHVDARDLAAKGTWRMAGDLFAGDRNDGVRILHDIASALHYIHGRGLVHNDIKPGNILYSRERGAVLCDLGLSTYAKNPISTGGTPWYVPPEYIAVKQRGAPSDVWALAVTMLYVLGKTPFPDARGHRGHPKHLHWLISKVHQHTRDRSGHTDAVSSMRQWLSEVNIMRSKLNLQDKLERLVFDMLAPNPNIRTTTKEILARFNDQITER